MAGVDWGGQPGSRLGLDIGGTLTKLTFFESQTRPSWCGGQIASLIKSFGAGGYSIRHGFGERDIDLGFDDEELAGTFHFVTFPSDHMEKFVTLIEEHALHAGLKSIYATGGGAYKYSKLFRDRLGVSLQPMDELGVVIQAIAWLVDRPLRDKLCFLDHSSSDSSSSTPSFNLDDGCDDYAAAPDPSPLPPPKAPVSAADPEPASAAPPWSAATGSTRASLSASPLSSCGDSTPMRSCLELGAKALFPFLLVNIGSGVSVVRVDGIDRFERVSGSAIGGGTFWGLCQLLCPSCGGFDEAGRLAEQGDSSSVNLLVEDIYGGDYTLPNGLKLPGSITASFFAKAARSGRRGAGGESGDNGQADDNACNSADLIHALTKMVSSNICQIALLNARLHNTPRIVFTGNFLRQNPVARQAILENMDRVSSAHQTRGEDPFRVLFLRHEGYFGALGSFLHNVQDMSTDVPRMSAQLPSFRRGGRELASTDSSPPPPGNADDAGSGGARATAMAAAAATAAEPGRGRPEEKVGVLKELEEEEEEAAKDPHSAKASAAPASDKGGRASRSHLQPFRHIRLNWPHRHSSSKGTARGDGETLASAPAPRKPLARLAGVFSTATDTAMGVAGAVPPRIPSLLAHRHPRGAGTGGAMQSRGTAAACGGLKKVSDAKAACFEPFEAYSDEETFSL